MRKQGIGSWPARRARRTPRRPALVHRGRTLDYADLHERSTRLAHALRTAGVRRGDRIAHLGPNHPAFLETPFAAGLLGALFVPLNTRLALPEITHQLDDCGARVLVHAPEYAPLVPPGAVPVTVETGAVYESWLAGADSTPIDEPVSLDDTCLIMVRDGWFRSGDAARSDAARSDADGYLTIADRIKDMYISGGEYVYPTEVEDALLALPGVAECAVYGVPDARWGEVGRAVVVPAAGAVVDPDALFAALAVVLAKCKLPKTVVLADVLPRTATGKIVKHRLRARYGG